MTENAKPLKNSPPTEALVSNFEKASAELLGRYRVVKNELTAIKAALIRLGMDPEAPERLRPARPAEKPATKTRGPQPPRNQSIKMRILRAIAEYHEPIVESKPIRTMVPEPTANTFAASLSHLIADGYIERVERGKYQMMLKGKELVEKMKAIPPA